MLRDLFVAAILVGGLGAILTRGPFYALLLYLWLAYFRPEQWLWQDWVTGLNLSYVLGAFLFIAAALRGALRIDSRFILPALFLLVAVLSTAQSDYAPALWPYVAEFAKVVVISYLIAVYADDLHKLRLVFATMAFGLGLEAVKQGWANLLLNPGGTNTNPVPFLGDNNGVALGMLMLLAIMVALAQTAPSYRQRRFLQFAAVGVAIRAITTYSRGGFLSAAALGLFYLARSERRFRTVLGLLVICLVVLPVMPPRFWDRMSTITASENARDESTTARLHYWHVATRMFEDNPMLGVGFNGFKAAYARYDDSAGDFGTEKAVHSAWFGSLAELGAVGFTVYLLMLLQTWILCRRTIRRSEANAGDSATVRAFAHALEGCLVVAIVGGTFLHVQYSEMLWHVFGLAIALDIAAQQVAPVAVANPLLPRVTGVPRVGQVPVPAMSRPSR